MVLRRCERWRHSKHVKFQMYYRRFLYYSVNISTPTHNFYSRLNYLSTWPRLVKTEQYKTYKLQQQDPAKPSGIVTALSKFIPVTLQTLLSQILWTSPTNLWQDNYPRMPPIPPESTRGMKSLDREAFHTVTTVPTLLVPVKHIGQFQKKVKKHLFKMQGIKPVAELNTDREDRDKYRLFIFDPDKFKTKEDFSEVAQGYLDELGLDLSTWEMAEIELNYVNWHYDDILHAVVPVESDGVGGFSVIGHILHLNLRDDLLPFRDIIGEVLLDKVSKVETVVNKTNAIDNTYRNFAMEVLAGKHDFVTTAKENGHTFKMDFSKVYWNSRLSTEHQRIVDQLQSGDIVYDVFAGIGPFAVPAAKKKCKVLANDLNPESYNWLKVNMTENKVKSDPQMYNLDGRDFIRTVLKPDLIKRWSEGSSTKQSLHIIMNLPALAVEFMDAFVGLFADSDIEQLEHVTLPTVHCYTFSKAEDPVADVKDCAQTALCCSLPTENTVRIVRNVAPHKEMLCIEFVLQKDVLFAKHTSEGCDAQAELEPPEKKTKLES